MSVRKSAADFGIGVVPFRIMVVRRRKALEDAGHVGVVEGQPVCEPAITCGEVALLVPAFTAPMNASGIVDANLESGGNAL